MGVADDDFSNGPQTGANLTLAGAVQLARQAQVRKEGQELLRGKVDCKTK